MLYTKGARTNTGSFFAILENIAHDMDMHPNNATHEQHRLNRDWEPNIRMRRPDPTMLTKSFQQTKFDSRGE